MTVRRVGLVLVAAGSSTRMGEIDKVWAPLRGEPVFMHSLHRLGPAADEIVLVMRDRDIERARDQIRSLRCRVMVVPGGRERHESVAHGIDALDAVTEIAVHDSARPFAPRRLLESGLALLREYEGAVPVVALADTVKEIDEQGLVARTIDRSILRAVQTPQVFRADVLRAAHAWREETGIAVTDDASILEARGARVATFDGDPRNFKITTQLDLRLADLLVAGDPA